MGRGSQTQSGDFGGKLNAEEIRKIWAVDEKKDICEEKMDKVVCTRQTGTDVSWGGR